MILYIVSAAVLLILLALLALSLASSRASRDSLNRAEQNIRAEINSRLDANRKSFDERLDATSNINASKLESIRKTTEESLNAVRVSLEKRLDELTHQNAEKLEQMRQTVDEKLQSTLEKRLGESFKLVGDNLERVIKSLGEMQAVASDVGDLKRVLTNVKTRGTWGEIQLAALLEDFLQADQFARNFKPKPRTDQSVEFAVKLPGPEENGAPVWLPIDSKFPRENYEALVQAADRADADAVKKAGKDLMADIEKCARDIRDKYIVPPLTTNFAVLFLPTEGLYAEALRLPGLADRIQRDYRVLIAGPTTLAALLNSLRVGFTTLAIQRRSSDVWKTLGAIKKQFDTFGALLENVRRKIDEAGSVVDKAADRHRIMTNALTKVEALPAAEASALTGLDAAASDDE